MRHNDNLATTESLSASQKTTIEKQTIMNHEYYVRKGPSIHSMKYISTCYFAYDGSIISVFLAVL